MVENLEQSGLEGVGTSVEQPEAHKPLADHHKPTAVIEYTGGTPHSAVDSTPVLAVGHTWHKDREPVVRWTVIDREGRTAAADQDGIRMRRD